jgi:hypothetical protein
MYHPDIEAWLASRGEVERLREMERKAAVAWFDALTLEQREVFSELLLGHDGIFHLQDRERKALYEGRRKREEG